MIIDPLTFVSIEMDRHLAVARAAQSARAALAGRTAERRYSRRRRGILLRVVAWATGRTVHA